MGDEIENPRRIIPWAILVGGSILAIGYISGTTALLVSLPSDAVGGPDGFVNGVHVLSARLGLGWRAGADCAAGGTERCRRRGRVSLVDIAAAVCGRASITIFRRPSDGFIRAIAHHGSRSSLTDWREQWWRCSARPEPPCAAPTTCW